MKQELPYQKHTHMMIQMNRFNEGLMIAVKWVEAKPRDPEAWFSKSACELMLMQARQALESIRKALHIKPNDLRFLSHKARCLVSAGMIKEGLEISRRLVQNNNLNPQLLDSLAITLSNAGESEEAIPIMERAIKLNPDVPQYYTNYGTILHFCNRTEDAEKAHRKALELFPEEFRGYWLLGQLRKATPGTNFTSWFDGLLKKYTEKLQARICLNYALAKQFEDLEDYDRAAHHLEAGAKATLEHMPYTEETNHRMLLAFRQNFDAPFMHQSFEGSENSEAIFIVGMPRSGTTLVERIIASYDNVFAAGELHNFTHFLNSRFEKINPGTESTGRYVGPERIDFKELGDAYIESTRPRTGETEFFIDKYPFNFQMVGPISKALPKAKFINLMRNPMDTCFSNYKLLFMLGSALYSYDQETLARFYAEYRKMMDHWHACLPGRILDVDYEKLVEDPEGQSKKITDFLGIEWRSECLEFYKSTEAVTTASSTQIREPINKSSLQKWKKFEKHLQPMKSALVEAGFEVE